MQAADEQHLQNRQHSSIHPKLVCCRRLHNLALLGLVVMPKATEPQQQHLQTHGSVNAWDHMCTPMSSDRVHMCGHNAAVAHLGYTQVACENHGAC